MSSMGLAVTAFVALLPITNPLGAIAAFAGMTGTEPKELANKTAIKTGIYVFAILAVFGLFGSIVLSTFGITVAALQIAGGLIVAHSGYGMLVPKENFTPAEKTHSAAKNDISFSPMALPLVAGPGAIGVVIALGARNPGIADHIAIAVAALGIGLMVGIALRYGTPLVKKLGPTGIGALTRVMGFLILTIGVELIVHGVLAVKR